jgi:hypothetical protein
MKNYELMGLQTASGEPILSPMVAMMCDAYLDYVNNYCLIGTWAEEYGVDNNEAVQFFDTCKAVYNAEHVSY